MKKVLNYRHEIQIMRNEMEQTSRSNGSVTVSPGNAVAKENKTFDIVYTVGEDTIFIGGVVRFTIPFGFTQPQADMPLKPGYCTAATDKAGASVKCVIVKSEWWKRGNDRTKLENVSEHVGTHVWVKVSGRALTKGDTVVLRYGDTSYSEMAAAAVCPTSGPVQFDAATDGDGRLKAPYSGFYLTENPAVVLVEPGRPRRFEVILPSDISSGLPFKVVVFPVDSCFNPLDDYEGEADCFLNDSLAATVRWAKSEKGKSALVHLMLTTQEKGVVKVRVENKDLAGESNPAVVDRDAGQCRHYWGDLHGHTGIQWGRGSGRAYYEYARDVAGLDFCALTDPDAGRYTNDNETAYSSLSCYMTDEKWKAVQETNRNFYEENKFIPILGYEYHNDAPNPEFGGDRNVYFDSYEQKIRRCVDEGSFCPDQLWQTFRRENIKAVTIPHHPAKKVMPGSWDVHDEEFQRLVEIYSSWGNSECEGCERPIIGGAEYEGRSVQEALKRGYRLGFVGGSDTHAGTPGYSHWVFSEDVISYRGGLTCVLAKELTRESVFEALWNRSVYATTGERILLEFSINEAMMGQELTISDDAPRNVKVRVAGTGPLDRVEIVSMGHSVYTKKVDGSSVEFTYAIDGSLENEWAYYYVRVLQKNKAMAWSSPIWIVSSRS